MIQPLLHSAGTRRPRGRSDRWTGVVAEALEARRLLAMVTWDGGGDGHSLLDRLNWSADVLPGSGDDAVIGGGNGPVSLLGGTLSLRSLVSARALTVDAAALAATGDLVFTGGLTLGAEASLLAGGAVRMTGAASRVVEIAGSIAAPSVVLDAGPGAVLRLTGRIDASGASGVGGRIDALGLRVVLEGAVLDASGAAGGGSIRVGGAYQGGPGARAADVTYIDADSRLLADARQRGDGGRVIVWSETVTGFYGKASARGGALAGNGGFVETSGKVALDATGEVDAGAPAGVAGTWLLDPRSVTVSASITAGGAFSGGNPTTFTPTADNANVLVTTVNSALTAGTAVIITTGATGTQLGSISLNAAISVSASMPGTLTLRAAGDILINANITMAGTFTPTVNLFANDITPGPDPDPATGSVIFSAGVSVSLSGGTLNITGVNLSTPTAGTITVGTIAATMSGNVQINGDISASSAGGINLQAGADGTGALSFGALGVDLNAGTMVLRAGDGTGGGGGLATVNLNTNSPTFRNLQGGATRPANFTFQQDAAIADGNIPLAIRFGSAIGGMRYTIQSDDGSITASTPSKIDATTLSLVAAGDVTLNAALSNFATVSIGADSDGNGAGTAAVNPSQTVSRLTISGASVVIPNAATINSTNGLFVAATSAVSLLGSVMTSEGIVYVQGVTITLGGVIAPQAGAQFVGGAGGITQVGGAIITTSLIAAATGPVSLPMANDLSLVALLAAGDLSFNDINGFTVDTVTIADTLSGATSTGVTALSISGAGGSIVINRTVSAETHVALTAPGGALTGSNGLINAQSLVLRGGAAAGGAQFSLSTRIQGLAASANAGITIIDTDALFVSTVDGVTGITASGRDVFLTSGGTGGIALNAPIDLSDGRLVLTSDGVVTQGAGGGIIAGSLVISGNGAFTLRNTANNVVNIAAAAGLGIVDYVDTDALFVSTVLGVSGVQRTAGVLISAGGTLTINANVISTGGAVTLASGLSGTGNLVFGLGPGGVSVQAATIVLSAGDGTGGAGTGAAVDAATSTAVFRGAGGGATNPTSFALRQDRAIADGAIPAPARFGAGTVAGLFYELRSMESTVSVATASRVNGSNLTLGSVSDTIITTSLSLASLVADANVRNSAASIVATGAVNFNFALATTADLTVGGSSVTFSGAILDGATPRNLTVTSPGLTRFLGAVNLLSVTTDAGGATQIGADMAADGALAFGDAVSVVADATISAGGTASFASSLALGGRALAIFADEIDFNGGPGSVTGPGSLQLAPVAAEAIVAVFSIGISPGVLDLTIADLSALADGLTLLTLGRADGTGPMTIRGGTLRDPTVFLTPGGIITTGPAALVGAGDAAFTFNAAGIVLGADVRTSAGAIAFNAPVTLATTVTIDTTALGAAPTGANIDFAGTVDGQNPGAQGLTASPGTAGRVRLGANVGVAAAPASLTIAGMSTIAAASVMTTGPQTYTGPMTLAASPVTTFTGALFNFNGAINATAPGQQGLVANGPAGFAAQVGQTSALRQITVNGNALFVASTATTSAGGGSGDITVSGSTTLGGAQDNTFTFTTTGGAARLAGGLVGSQIGEQGLIVAGNLLVGGSGAGSVALRSLQVSGTTTVTSAGSIRTSSAGGGTGAQAYGGAVVLTGALVLDAAGGDVSTAAAITAGASDLTIRARDLLLGGAVSGTGRLAIEPDTAGGHMLLGATDGPGGAIDLSTATLLRIGAGFASVTFGRADGSGTITIASAFNAINPTTFRAPVAPGRIIVNALVTATGNGSLTFQGAGSTVILNADVRTDGRPIVFDDAVQIGVALVTIDTTNNGQSPAGADISFLFALDSEPGETNAVVVRSGTAGVTTFVGPVGQAATGALSALTTDAGGTTLIGASVRAGVLLLADPVLLTGSATFTGNAMTFGGTLNAAGGAPTASFAAQGAGAMLTFGGVVGGVTPLGAITTGSGLGVQVNTASVRTAGAQTYGGPVALGAGVTFIGGSLAFNAGILGNGFAMIATSPGMTTFGGVSSGLASLATDAPGQTVIAGTEITATGNVMFGDGVAIQMSTLIRSLGGVVGFGQTLAAGPHTLTISGVEINFLGAVSGTGRIILLQSSPNQNYNVAHATEGEGEALDITAAELDLFAPGFEQIQFGTDDGGAIMDVESYTFNAGIQINMPGVGGQIFIQGAIAVDADEGNIDIRGNGSTTHLRGNLTTRGGAITINDSVLLEAALVEIDSTAGGTVPGGAISILHRINSQPNAGRALTLRAGAAAALLGGDVGGQPGGQPGSLMVFAGGGIALNPALLRTLGAQRFAGPVSLGPAVTIQTNGAPVDFDDTVGGQSNLTIGAGTGAVRFGGGVGQTTTLASLTINTGSTRIFDGAVSVGVLTVFGGNVAFNGLTNITTGLLIAGNLGGTGTINFDLPLTWVGGDMVGTGVTHIRRTGALVISGGPKTLSRRIEVAGETYWTDGSVNFAGGAFVNLPTGRFFAQSSGAFVGVSGTSAFDNQGFLERSGAGAAGLTNLLVTNSGEMALAQGDLHITPSGPGNTFGSSGVITLGSASTLMVTGDLALGPAARLNTTLAGTGAGQFGQVVVTGAANVNGVLAIDLAPSYVPAGGERFAIVTAATRLGTFGMTIAPIVPGRMFITQHNPGDVTVLVAGGLDFNGDGSIDPDDLSDFITAFFMLPPDQRADFNGDGTVDPDDLSDYITAFFGR